MGIASCRQTVVAVAVAALLPSATPARAGTPVSLVRPLAGAEVDWSAGTVTARAGAAADMRMPSPDAARPGAKGAPVSCDGKAEGGPACATRARQRKVGEKQVEAALGQCEHGAHRVPVEWRRGVVGAGAVRGSVGKCYGHDYDRGHSHGHDYPLRGLRDGQPAPPAPARFARARRGHGHGAGCSCGCCDAVAIGSLGGADGKEIVVGRMRYHQGPPPAGRSLCAATTRGGWCFPRAPRRRLIGSPADRL